MTRRPSLPVVVLLVVAVASVSCGRFFKQDVVRVPHAAVDSEIIDDLLDAIDSGRYGEMHSLTVLVDGETVLDAYFNGHRRDRRHPLYSVTKSVLSAVVGIAVGQGLLSSVDARVLGFFEEYSGFAHHDQRKDRITLEHLLTMSAGLQWDELSRSYDDPANDYRRYLESPDRIKYALDLPMVAEPGARIGYNTALSSVLSVIVSKATGMSAAEYAGTWLFAPLGIEDWQWSEFRPGISVGGAGLYLRPADMAKFGQLYLQRGRWDGQQVVPSDWVDTSTSAHGNVDQLHGYGYQWWTYTEHAATNLLNGHGDIYCALGRGGQHIWVLPWADAVVVCTAWNDGNGYWPEPMLWEYVGPALLR